MKISAPAIRHLARALALEDFGSAEEARARVFEVCEQQARQSWFTDPEDVTVVTHRQFAQAMPVHESNGRWKVGLQEYLSNCTSDFSDGTNGEPTAYPPSGGGVGGNVGLPDYKFLERQKERRKKLLALKQRRDPDGISSNTADKALRTIGENEEQDLDHKDVSPDPRGLWVRFERTFTRKQRDATRAKWPGMPERTAFGKQLEAELNKNPNIIGQFNLNDVRISSCGWETTVTFYAHFPGHSYANFGSSELQTELSNLPRYELLQFGPLDESQKQPSHLILYHASPQEFDTFDTSKEGAHFGTFDQASSLNKPGKGEPKAYAVNIQNPLRMPDIGVWNNFNNFHAALSRADIVTEEEANAAWVAWQHSDDYGWEFLKNTLEAKGYDGIVYENEQEGAGDSYIAFRSEQIKPAQQEAVDNFDDDILKEVGGPFSEYGSEPPKRFGWSLFLGSEFWIKYRAVQAEIPITNAFWETVTEDHIKMEHAVIRAFNQLPSVTLGSHGHSSEHLVGNGRMNPREVPKLWKFFTEIGPRSPFNIFANADQMGIDKSSILQAVSEVGRKVLVPHFEYFDMEDGS